MGHSFLYARQNMGLLWHTAVRPSVYASYDIMAQLFILSYSDAISFRDIRDHLGTIPSIVTFYLCAYRRRRL